MNPGSPLSEDFVTLSHGGRAGRVQAAKKLWCDSSYL